MIGGTLSSCDGGMVLESQGNKADMGRYFEGASTPEMALDASKKMNKKFRGFTFPFVMTYRKRFTL